MNDGRQRKEVNSEKQRKVYEEQCASSGACLRGRHSGITRTRSREILVEKGVGVGLRQGRCVGGKEVLHCCTHVHKCTHTNTDTHTVPQDPPQNRSCTMFLCNATQRGSLMADLSESLNENLNNVEDQRHSMFTHKKIRTVTKLKQEMFLHVLL